MNDLELAELMSPGVWQALISAAWFAITEGVSEIHLRQLLLGILSTCSEHGESGSLSASLISPHDARAILADCGGFTEKPLSPDRNEFASANHHVPLEKEVAETLGEALPRHAINGSGQFTADDLLKSLQPMLSKSFSNDESNLSLERQLYLYLHLRPPG